jgi:hypothetical protein
MSWIKALKTWNDSKKDHKNAWCVPKKGTLEYNQVINIMHGINNKNNSNGINNNNNSSKEELLIMAKNITSYVTHSDQFQSQYEKNWNSKSIDDLLKIINNFKKKYPDIKIKKTPIKMGVYENLGPRL